MHFFDYSFLATAEIPASIMNTALVIGELRTLDGLRLKDYPQIFESLESIARVQSVKTSNEIEGIVTTDERIHAIVNENCAPLGHDEQEIAGYRDALDFVHSNYQHLDLDESTILNLHRILLSHTATGSQGYKTTNNVIVDITSDGQRHVRFRPTSAADTPADMEQLVLAYTMAVHDGAVNKLLLIACFIFDFLCIHPFSDGNGRMSRLLTLFLLYKHGFEVGKYISLEEQINNQKPWYYQSLQQSCEGWAENENTYIPFVENFCAMLLDCYRNLNERFAVVDDVKPTKTRRIENTIARSILPLSKHDIVSAMPDISLTTVEAVVGKMVKEGSARKVGSYRNARYIGVKRK